jgi:CheY-like chemotaxis protein
MQYAAIFLDDYSYVSENQLFRMRLRKNAASVGGLDIREERTVGGFEQAVSLLEFDVVILDLMMAAPDSMRRIGDDSPVPSSMVGLEILERCRAGAYGDHYRDAPVFIRTARGESHIQRACLAAGATGFYRAGGEDVELVQHILRVVSEGEL